jgi:hypothetical protein
VRTFTARHPGRCGCGCDGQIRPGDDVVYVDGALLLAACATDTTTPPREPAVCPSCWTVHRGECL